MSPRLDTRAGALAIVAAIVLSVLGAATIVYATAQGPWAFSDSAAYIGSAINFAQGKGLGLVQASGDFSPLTHYPPGYSLVLSIAAFLHIDVLHLARWLDVSLFASLLLMVSLLVYRYSSSLWLSILVPAVIVTSPVLVYQFSGATSEPLFIFLAMAGVFVLAEGLSTGRGRFFVLAGCLAGLATLVRYAGVFLIVAGLALIALLAPGRFQRRVASIAGFVSPALLLVLVWFVAATGMENSQPARLLAIPRGSLWEASQLFRAELADTLWRLSSFSASVPHPPYWLIHLAWVTALLTAFVLGVWVLARERRKLQPEAPGGRSLGLLVALLSSYVVVYLGTLAMAHLFTLPTPDVNERILSPALVPAWLVVALAVPAAVRARPRLRSLPIIPLLLSAGLILRTAPSALETIEHLHAVGDGYTSRAWRQSETVEALRSLPVSTPIITNEGAALLLLTGRTAYDLPQLQAGERRANFDRFGDDPSGIAERAFRREGGALILFDSVLGQLRSTYGEEASVRLAELTGGLELSGRFADGAIYFYPQTD